LGWQSTGRDDRHVVARRSKEYAEFLARLRSARAAAGLSQAAAGARLGKPQSYVSKSESGERRVDVIELAAFARVYAVPVAFFFDADLVAYRPRARSTELRRVAERSRRRG
jgi:transcriptional regulator with XRE-family HTH domain